MIVDGLDYADRWQNLHPGFAAAFAYLRQAISAPPPAGKHVLEPDRLWVIVEPGQGRTRAQAPLEFHRRYIDIQLVLAGEETIGWSPLSAQTAARADYDSVRDIAFLTDVPRVWLPLRVGEFAVFFPHDAHAPLAGETPVVKAIAKVAVDW